MGCLCYLYSSGGRDASLLAVIAVFSLVEEKRGGFLRVAASVWCWEALAWAFLYPSERPTTFLIGCRSLPQFCCYFYGDFGVLLGLVVVGSTLGYYL